MTRRRGSLRVLALLPVTLLCMSRVSWACLSPRFQTQSTPWPVSVHRHRAASGPPRPDRLRRPRSQALHHRDQRRRRGARRLRPRRLARCARAQRHDVSKRAHARMRPIRSGSAPTNRLYRNRHDGTFEDVTDAAGLRRTGWASSVCAGDYDNDGWTDLFVTVLRPQRALPESRRTVRGRDAKAGLATTGIRWGSGCTFVDYDRDGRLDLFVANYLRFDLATAAEPGAGAELPAGRACRSTAGPKGCRPTPTCSIATTATARSPTSRSASGIAKVTGRYSMTASAADLDEDGWPDIYVACDSTAAILYRNNHDGTFTDVAVESGDGLQRERQRAGGHGPGASATTTATAGSICSRRTSPTTSRRCIAISGRACSRTWRPRRASPSRTGSSSGARDCPTSTTTAVPDLFYVTGNVYPEIERVLPQYPHRSPRVVFRNVGERPVRARHDRERRCRDRRTRAAAPRSATSTTTATSTCW